MSAEPDTIDAAEAMLAKLAGLDLSLAQHVHACAMATDDTQEVAELARAYQRIARSMRQSLALHARLKRERERDRRENPPPPPARDEARIRRRIDELRQPVQRVIWAEHEHPEDEHPEQDGLAGYYFDLLEERMHIRAGDDAFGLEPLDDHIARLCRDLGLAEELARTWRDLPDPPPEALLPPDEDDEGDEESGPESGRESSA